MFLTKGNLAVGLLVIFVSLSLALPRVDDNGLKRDEEAEVPDASELIVKKPETDARKGRFLLPADFAVKQKRFSIGTQGVASFFRAWRNCIDEGKGLATIESAKEQSFLESMLQTVAPQTRYWIGATNLGASDNNTLTWITTDLPVETAPDSLTLTTTTTCITLSPSGRWRRNNCYSSVHPYLCEEYY